MHTEEPAAPFQRRGGVLHAGDLSVEELADRFGTPLYVYDAAWFDGRIRAFQEAFQKVDLLLAYSVKANSNLALLRRVADLGAGADIVSGGELYRALEAGIPADRIVFAGVGKTEDEMRAALEAGIRSFHVESAGELRALDRVAGALGVRAPFAIRINPDVETPSSHAYTRTGHAASKFGVPVNEAMELYRWARERSALEARGVDAHIGSQVTETGPYLAALNRVLEVVDALGASDIDVEYVDLGGGFAVPVKEGDARLRPSDLAAVLESRLVERGLDLILEPGRAVAGEAGILVARTLYVKSQGGKTFVISDAAMNDLIRPSLYQGYHEIVSVVDDGREPTTVDLVGPICESGDFLGKDRSLPLPEPGDLLAIRNTGAYGFAMSSQYNSRPRAAEVLVDGDEAHLVRERETLDDLIRGERIP